MPTEIKINNPHLDQAKVPYNKLIRYQVGKICKSQNAETRAEEVRDLWKLVGENNSSVKELQFGKKQEDADEFITSLLNSIYDEKGPLFETSLIRPTNEQQEQKFGVARSCKAKNEPVIKIPINKKNKFSDLVNFYQKEENLADSESVSFESNSDGQARKLATSKKLSLFVEKGQKEIFFELKRFTHQNDGKSKKINDDIDINDIEFKTYEKEQEIEALENKNEKTKYQPTAFSVHSSKTTDGGHYYSYVKEKESDGKESWYRYDDGSRTKVGDENAKKAMKQAYILKFSAVENGKVDLPLANDNEYWSKNLGNTCWANSSVAIVAKSKLGEECKKVTLNDAEKKLYYDVIGNKLSKKKFTFKPNIETTNKKNKTENEANEIEEKHIKTNQNTERNRKTKTENKESKDNNPKNGVDFSIDDLLPQNSNEQKNHKNKINARKSETLDILQLDGEKVKNKSDNFLEEEVKKINLKRDDAILEELKNIVKKKEKELPKIEKMESLKPIIALEEEIKKKVGNKEFVAKKLEQSKEDDQKFRKYVEEKYKNVELKIFTKHSSEKPSIKTLELVEEGIQKKDEVFPNKLARALGKLANIPNSRKEESAKIEAWKNLTTLDRRVLVDLYNNKNGEKIEFTSLYRDVKNKEKSDLSINGHNYALDLSKSYQIGKLIDCANKLIPENLVEKPSSEKLLGDRNMPRYQ